MHENNWCEMIKRAMGAETLLIKAKRRVVLLFSGEVEGSDGQS